MTYHSEVVGSLLRPAYLVEARQQFEAGKLNAADFKTREDQAVNEAIALQESVSIDVITDGEMLRYAFFGHLVDSLEGFDKYGGWGLPFKEEAGEQFIYRRPVVVERLRRQELRKQSIASESMHVLDEEPRYYQPRNLSRTASRLIISSLRQDISS